MELITQFDFILIYVILPKVMGPWMFKEEKIFIGIFKRLILLIMERIHQKTF